MTSWGATPIRTLSGRLSNLSGRELQEMRNIYPEADDELYLKKGSVLTTENKVVIDSLNYDVLFVDDPLECGEFLVAIVKNLGK